MIECVLHTKGLSKSFGKIKVLHDINISISHGEVYGLIGQNGAGKTTLLRLISGLMKPTSGSVKVQTRKPFIGYMPQSCRFDGNATVEDTICFFAKIRNADIRDSSQLGNKLKLDMSKRVRHLSPGQQKKLQMIIAMIGEPDLYILDEPTAGLDPNATFEMKNIIKDLHEKGKSIIISSHILQDMDEICTNVAIMEKGRLTYNNKIESSYIIKTAPINNGIFNILSKHYKIASDNSHTVHTVKITEDQVPALIVALVSHNICIYEVTVSNVKNLVQKHLHFAEEVQ